MGGAHAGVVVLQASDGADACAGHRHAAQDRAKGEEAAAVMHGWHAGGFARHVPARSGCSPVSCLSKAALVASPLLVFINTIGLAWAVD